TARTYEITIAVVDGMARGFVAGVPTFAIAAPGAKGRIGLYSWHDGDARFSNVFVWPLNVAFADWEMDETFPLPSTLPWTTVDEGREKGPSTWTFGKGLCQ